MSFQASSILWALFAVSIPVIIHLLNRRRHRTVKWAAMSFILKATRESRGKKKLKHIIILTCRTLALAGLIFAVAQPLVGGWFGWGSTKIDTVVLVLDRSSSMENETGNDRESKRERVIAQVKETFAELDNTPNLILIDSASGEIQQISSIDALDNLSTTAATDTEADIPNLIEKASSYIIGNSNSGKTEFGSPLIYKNLTGTLSHHAGKLYVKVSRTFRFHLRSESLLSPRHLPEIITT